MQRQRRGNGARQDQQGSNARVQRCENGAQRQRNQQQLGGLPAPTSCPSAWKATVCQRFLEHGGLEHWLRR